jgi:hypothetical protein
MYSPLYFLSALGSGGIVVTFFLWLLFWVAHPGHPIPIYEDVVLAFQLSSTLKKIIILSAVIGILFFLIWHLKLMFWNFKNYFKFSKTSSGRKMLSNDTQVQRLAVPLALSMSINVMFIFGAIFIPKLWSVIEYLFPFAIIGFLIIGLWSMSMYGNLFQHALKGNFNMNANTSFAQVLPAFTFSMVAVGLSAPAAMSHNEIVVSISLILSSFFIVVSIFLALVKTISGLHQIFTKGIKESAIPTLWILIPIVTVLGIALMRQTHGVVHTLHLGKENSLMPPLTAAVCLQIFVFFLGYQAMKIFNYIPRMFRGEIKTPSVFAIICPGVAFAVLLQFYINKGLVASGIIIKFSLPYILLSILPLGISLVTIILFVKLNQILKVGKKLY